MISCQLLGIGACDGIAIGAVQMLAPGLVVVQRAVPISQIPVELERLDKAIASTDQQLDQLGRQLVADGRHEGYLIIEAHRMMLKSDHLMGSARAFISEALSAESAVRRAVDGITARFENMPDPYLRERGADIEAVGERLLGTLLGLPDAGSTYGDVIGSIGVGATVSPIDAFHLGRAGLAGLVTERGGKTSHATIIVKALQIPYVFGVKELCRTVRPGDTLIVDGRMGRPLVVASPRGQIGDQIVEYELLLDAYGTP